MKKIYLGVAMLLLGMAGTASAASITFTDTTLFTGGGTLESGDLVSYGGTEVNYIGDATPDWVTWKHQYTFDPAADTIISAVLDITLADDTDKIGNRVDKIDLIPEYALGWGEDWTWALGEVDTGIYNYTVGIEHVADGTFFVTIGNLGVTDFKILRSDLTVTYDPVPEPATMLLFATGLAGLAGVSRRRKK